MSDVIINCAHNSWKIYDSVEHGMVRECTVCGCIEMHMNDDWIRILTPVIGIKSLPSKGILKD